MTSILKTLTIIIVATFFMALSATGQRLKPTFTVDSLPSQALSVPIQQPDTNSAVSTLSPPQVERAIYKIDSIAQDLSDTKENTNPWLTPETWKTIAGISLFVAIVGLFISFLSGIISFFNYKEQKETQRNTERLTLVEQQDILIDLVRHLYRNLVVTRTIETKMRALDFQAYPSEEHLVKLQIPLERIKLDSFLNTNFSALSNLYLLFRNYNEEVMIIKDHFKNEDLNQEAKERDLETLTFKCSFLASRIYSFLIDNSPKRRNWNLRFGKTLIEIFCTKQPQSIYSSNEIRLKIGEVIKKSQYKNIVSYSGNAILPEIKNAIEPYENKENLFMKFFDSEEQKKAFLEGLNRDIRIECGNKQKAEEMVEPNFKYKYTTDKIYMIKFKTKDKTTDQQDETKRQTDETNE